MWCFRRALDCHKSWNGAPEDVGFVTVFTYVRIALDEDEIALSERRFDACTTTALGETISAAPLREMEAFLCGFSTGHVLRCEVVPSSRMRLLRAGEEGRLIYQLHRHGVSKRDDAVEGLEGGDVMSIAALGTICASVGGDKCCRVSFFHPLPCDAICTLHHPHAVRSVLLHEGKKSWTDENPQWEATALYAVTGDDVGVVRLWRIDVVEKTYFLHSVFVAGAYGTHGDASTVSHSIHESATSARLFGKPLYAIAFDGDVEEAERLLVTTDGRLLCFDTLRTVGFKTNETDHSIIGQENDPSCLVRLRRLAGEFVWCKSDVAVLKVLRDYQSHQEAAPSLLTQEATKWKHKHEVLVAQGMSIGAVTNEILCQGPDGADALIPCSFPGIANTARWPASCLEPCILPSLVVNVDSDHSRPVFSLVVLGPGRLATGDAAGHVKLWQFTAAEGQRGGGLYMLMYDVPDAHDGQLVKSLGLLRSPDVFVSFGYDGSFREWHVYNDAEPSGGGCALANVVTVADKQRDDGDDKMGICWGTVAAEFGAVFAVSLFETSIRTYALLQCDTCAIPPGFVFNGLQTVCLADVAHLK